MNILNWLVSLVIFVIVLVVVLKVIALLASMFAFGALWEIVRIIVIAGAVIWCLRWATAGFPPIVPLA